MPDVSTVLVDANMLTLWIVGQVSEEEVPRCRRTRHYSIADYRILSEYLGQFTSVVITPNVATETSNLIGVLTGKYLEHARAILAAGLQVWSEQYIRSFDASSHSQYTRLGLTDAGILLTATEKIEILTDDFDLYMSLMKNKIPVTNFNHMREVSSA